MIYGAKHTGVHCGSEYIPWSLDLLWLAQRCWNEATTQTHKKKSDNNKTTPVVDDTAVLASEGGVAGGKIQDVSIDARMKNPIFRRTQPA